MNRGKIYYGWFIVATVFFVLMVTMGARVSLGVFVIPMSEEFGWSRSLYTGAMTIGTVLGGALALGIGPLLDRYGGRWALVVAFTVLGAIWVLMAAIQTLWQFYALQILARTIMIGVVGLGMGVIIPKWFIAKRGRALALSGMRWSRNLFHEGRRSPHFRGKTPPRYIFDQKRYAQIPGAKRNP